MNRFAPRQLLDDLSAIQRTVVLYGGFSLLLLGNYFLVGGMAREPLALPVIGEQYLWTVTALMLVLYLIVCVTAVATAVERVYIHGFDDSQTRLVLAQSGLLLVIAHLMVLYIPLFTGASGIPTFY
jgi:hypothetical protein